jgi:hypothetical protein
MAYIDELDDIRQQASQQRLLRDGVNGSQAGLAERLPPTPTSMEQAAAQSQRYDAMRSQPAQASAADPRLRLNINEQGQAVARPAATSSMGELRDQVLKRAPAAAPAVAEAAPSVAAEAGEAAKTAGQDRRARPSLGSRRPHRGHRCRRGRRGAERQRGGPQPARHRQSTPPPRPWRVSRGWPAAPWAASLVACHARPAGRRGRRRRRLQDRRRGHQAAARHGRPGRRSPRSTASRAQAAAAGRRNRPVQPSRSTDGEPAGQPSGRVRQAGGVCACAAHHGRRCSADSLPSAKYKSWATDAVEVITPWLRQAHGGDLRHQRERQRGARGLCAQRRLPRRAAPASTAAP